MEINDSTVMRDELGPGAGVVLLDRVGIMGHVIADRFTPPAEAERRELVLEMPRSAVLERLEDLGCARNPRRVLRRRRALAHALLWAPEYRVERLESHNLITQVGDQYYGERATGIVSPPAQVTGMKLGTGSTAPSKTGAGAALVTYRAGSQKAIDSSFPASSLSGASRQIQWKSSWGIGVINGVVLTEVAMVNDVLADATSLAAATIARALFGPMTLGANDTLAMVWNHLLLGA